MTNNSLIKCIMVSAVVLVFPPLVFWRLVNTSPYPPQQIKFHKNEMSELSQIMYKHGFEDTHYFATPFTISKDWDYKWFEKKYSDTSPKLYVNLIFLAYESKLDVHIFQEDSQAKPQMKKQMGTDFKNVKSEIGQKFELLK